MNRVMLSLPRPVRRWLHCVVQVEDSQAACLLFNQPLDVLFQILDYLPPESAVALTLTCKLAYRNFFPDQKRRLDKWGVTGVQGLLSLLEESVSRKLFLCHDCTKFHRHAFFWRPGQREKSINEPSCKPAITPFSDIYIGFHHVRLVMNEHLFGRGHGIKLKQLQVTIRAWTTGWTTVCVPRIIGRQLFLQISHRLLLYEHRDTNRAALSTTYRHHICHHVTAHACRRDPRNLTATLPTQISGLRPLSDRATYDETNDFVDVPGSCSVCLMDFSTSLRRVADVKDPTRETLDVTVVAFHQLGQCRTPTDWKWQLFSTRVSNYPPVLITRAHYLESYHPPGAVKKRWELST